MRVHMNNIHTHASHKEQSITKPRHDTPPQHSTKRIAWLFAYSLTYLLTTV